MKSAVVYVCSIQIGSDPSADMMARDLHYYWQGQNNHYIYGWWMKQAWTRGRFFEQESAALLNEIELHGSKLEGKLEFVDLGTLSGKILGLARGITSAPAAVCKKKKYVGYQNTLAFICQTALEEE